MRLIHTLRSITTTSVLFKVGARILGPSGVHGTTLPKRLRAIRRLAERFARRHVHPTVAGQLAGEVADAVWDRVAKDETFLDGRKPIPPVIKGIVRRMASRRVQDTARRRRREAVHAEELSQSVHTWMDPEARLSEADAEEVIRRALTRLTAAEQEVFSLSTEDGLSYPEIAKRRGTSVATVRKQKVRALRIYRQACIEVGFTPPPPRRTAKLPKGTKGGPHAAS